MLFKYMLALAGSFLFFVDPLLASGLILFFALAMLALVAVATAAALWSKQARRREDARQVLLILCEFFFAPKKR
ncbi:hypothetical protein [Streptomyces sp. NPDC095613]|uniref:hypothetical protein n=1 Tax=Streptomyces sp. NPDC095613 TaxID=3155540 RepID=UPI00332B5F25